MEETILALIAIPSKLNSPRKMKTSFNIPISHEHQVYLSENQEFDRVLLLLHGYQLNGQFMFKRYADSFGQRVKVIAPNAPFLAPIKKADGWEARYSWYFYDSDKMSFIINYEPAAKWLASLMEQVNPLGKPLTIIGYSQGGFIAPKVAELATNVEKVIGINSIFRSERFTIKPEAQYIQINGSLDDIVPSKQAKTEFDKLIGKGASGQFIELEEGHPLNRNLIKRSLETLGALA